MRQEVGSDGQELVLVKFGLPSIKDQKNLLSAEISSHFSVDVVDGIMHCAVTVRGFIIIIIINDAQQQQHRGTHSW